MTGGVDCRPEGGLVVEWDCERARRKWSWRLSVNTLGLSSDPAVVLFPIVTLPQMLLLNMPHQLIIRTNHIVLAQY